MFLLHDDPAGALFNGVRNHYYQTLWSSEALYHNLYNQCMEYANAGHYYGPEHYVGGPGGMYQAPYGEYREPARSYGGPASGPGGPYPSPYRRLSKKDSDYEGGDEEEGGGDRDRYDGHGGWHGPPREEEKCVQEHHEHYEKYSNAPGILEMTRAKSCLYILEQCTACCYAEAASSEVTAKAAGKDKAQNCTCAPLPYGRGRFAAQRDEDWKTKDLRPKDNGYLPDALKGSRYGYPGHGPPGPYGPSKGPYGPPKGPYGPPKGPYGSPPGAYKCPGEQHSYDPKDYTPEEPEYPYEGGYAYGGPYGSPPKGPGPYGGPPRGPGPYGPPKGPGPYGGYPGAEYGAPPPSNYKPSGYGDDYESGPYGYPGPAGPDPRGPPGPGPYGPYRGPGGGYPGAKYGAPPPVDKKAARKRDRKNRKKGKTEEEKSD